MKTNEQVSFYMDRLKTNPIDAQSWAFLGDTMVRRGQSKTAHLCYERAILLDPFTVRADEILRIVGSDGDGEADQQVLDLLKVKPTTVSACILTRDSSRTIQKCIEALQGAVDEIIVVDTGSTDDTVAIVESFGIKVHHFPWCDDFSAARNYALSIAMSEWAIFVDSDEILFSDDKDSIRTIAGLFDQTGFVLNILIQNQSEETVITSQAVRMFKLSCNYIWKYPIHEYVVDPNSDKRLKSYTTRIRFHHDGYNPQLVNIKDKYERNIRMLRKVVQDEPTNIRYLFFLGRELLYSGNQNEAIDILLQSQTLARDSNSDLLADISILIYKTYKDSGQKDRALSAIHQLTLDVPNYPDGWYLYGKEIIESPPYDLQQAIDIFTKAKNAGIAYRGPAHFDPEIGKWQADYVLQQLFKIKVNQVH